MVNPYRPKAIKCYRLEEGAVLGAEGAQILRDHKDAFGTVPLDDIQSSITAVVHCMDSTGDGRNRIGVILVGHPKLAAKRPEGARHHRWTFNFSNLSCAVEVAEIGDRSGPVHLPNATAKFTRHEHDVAKCALLIEGNPGMVRRAATVWDGREQCGRIG